MAFARPGDRPAIWQLSSDGRLAGLRSALAQFEVPANDGIFDDLLRRLAAIDVPDRAAPCTRPPADGDPLQDAPTLAAARKAIPEGRIVHDLRAALHEAAEP